MGDVFLDMLCYIFLMSACQAILFVRSASLGGLEACFRKAKHPKCLVLGVDVPLVPVEELKKLLEHSRGSSAPAVILRHGEKEEPLIGVYASCLADKALYEISFCKGSVFAFIGKIGCETVESCAAETAFANINDRNSYNCII